MWTRVTYEELQTGLNKPAPLPAYRPLQADEARKLFERIAELGVVGVQAGTGLSKVIISRAVVLEGLRPDNRDRIVEWLNSSG